MFFSVFVFAFRPLPSFSITAVTAGIRPQQAQRWRSIWIWIHFQIWKQNQKLNDFTVLNTNASSAEEDIINLPVCEVGAAFASSVAGFFKVSPGFFRTTSELSDPRAPNVPTLLSQVSTLAFFTPEAEDPCKEEFKLTHILEEIKSKRLIQKMKTRPNWDFMLWSQYNWGGIGRIFKAPYHQAATLNVIQL